MKRERSMFRKCQQDDGLGRRVVLPAEQESSPFEEGAALLLHGPEPLCQSMKLQDPNR
jgi:hypothetical protein